MQDEIDSSTNVGTSELKTDTNLDSQYFQRFCPRERSVGGISF